MKKILYVGIFSGSNLGDLVISNEIYQYLKNKNDILIELMDFLSLKKIHNIDPSISVKLEYNNIQKFKNIVEEYDFVRRIYFKYLDFTASYDSGKLYEEYILAVDDIDMVCIGGGNLLMSIANDSWAIKMNKLIKIAKKKEKKVYIMSVGVGPILSSKSKELFKKSIEIADCITVRDEYSRNLLVNDLDIDKEIEITGDPALLLQDFSVKINKKMNEHINIAISIMPFGKKSISLPDYKSYNYYKEMYKNLIEYFCKNDCNFIINLFSTEANDYAAIEDIYTYIISNSKFVTTKNLKVVDIKTLDELLEFYCHQNLLIGTRMHSLIIAYTQFVPIIAISWQNKVEGFMKYIDSLSCCYQLDSVNENISRIYLDACQKLKNGVRNETRLLKMKEKFDQITTFYIYNAN